MSSSQYTDDRIPYTSYVKTRLVLVTDLQRMAIASGQEVVVSFCEGAFGSVAKAELCREAGEKQEGEMLRRRESRLISSSRKCREGGPYRG
jgi:hypothetical protein